LNESGMENHPLTPMRDANLVRVLSRQTDGTVGLVPFATVAGGAAAIRRALTGLAEQHRRYAIVDAVLDDDLIAIGEAVAGHPLITGGSGIAMGLPANFRRAGALPERTDPGALPAASGAAAVLAGSCSRATLMQIAKARDAIDVLELDPLATPDAAALVRQAVAWLAGRLGETPVVLAASGPPDRVAALQAKLGRNAAGELVETVLADIAEYMMERGVRRLVVAGGETSGAVVARLGATRLRIGEEIDPGVPWTLADTPHGPIHLALKSGNFGGPDFFTRAFELLPRA
jgi:3-dehydrotetronate 4-kinase